MQGKIEHYTRFDEVHRTDPGFVGVFFPDDQIKSSCKGQKVIIEPQRFFLIKYIRVLSYFSCQYTVYFLLSEQWRKLPLLMLFVSFLWLGNQIIDFPPIPKSLNCCCAVHVLMATAEVLYQDTGISIFFKVCWRKETVLILYFQVIHKYYWKYLKRMVMLYRLFFFILILIPRLFNVRFQIVKIQQSIHVF